MSIGTLGSAGDQFRDFLGGGQKDIGQGLQSVLSNYANPDGNFIRLADRSRNMFQLSSSEYQKVYDQDAQNQFAETWYAEYRAILLLRAEALKKKLNRSYNRVLENAIYAPVRPGEAWAPEANRDQNDINANDPLKFFSGGTVKGPPAPTSTEVPPDDFIHPAWFSGTGKYSSGDAYDDLRRYINAKYALDDLDGDGEKIVFNPGPGPAGSTTPNDGSYGIAGEGSAMNGSNYYDLWRDGTIYGLNSPTGTWWTEIEREMNIPPSTTTQNFLAYDTNAGEDNYFIQIPPGETSQNGTIFGLLPSFIQANATGTGTFTAAQKTILTSAPYKVPAAAFKDMGGFYVLDAGTKFYDPVAIPSQAMFTSGGPFNDVPGGPITGINLNPDMIGPPGANVAEQDIAGGGSTPAYQRGFIDSWMEARALQKREAQIEAAYRAYVNGNAKIGGKMTYEEVMDQVFNALDQVAGPPGGVLPPGVPPGGPSLPPGAPAGGNGLLGMMPYGFYYEPSGAGIKLSHPGLGTNPVYDVGVEYVTDADTDANSVYRLIFDRLALAADPTSLPGGSSGTAAFSGSLPPPIPTPATPPTPAGQRDEVADSTSHLYTPIPVGAAENNDGQPNINHSQGVDDLEDTTHLNPGFANSTAEISKLFVGRQWDYAAGYDQGTESTVAGTTDIAPVKYEASTISVHLMVLPGWWYDASGTNASLPSIPVTLLPPIDGFGWRAAASAGGLGRIDDVSNTILGGPFFQVGGGQDSLGLGPDLDGSPLTYSFPGTGAGIGIGGIYWGHTSAIGTIGRVEELMDNSGEDVAAHSGSSAGPAFEVMKASLGVLAGLGGGDVQEMSLFPNVGLAGFHFDANIPIPIPPPIGLSFLNVPMTTYGSTSYDIMTHLMHEYLDGMKHEVIDSLSAYSYATSGGYAMDSYGMRGEYQFTEKTAFNSLDKMPKLLGLVNVASIIESAVNLIGLADYTINNYNLNDEGIFDGDRRHSFNAGEGRELDTGAFFSAAAFLSQFQLNNLEYSYWTSTHQNEEAANMDVMRLMALTGKELMKVLNKAVFGIAGRIEVDGFLAAIPAAILNFMLAGYQQSLNEALMWDLLLHDQNETGFVTSSKIKSSSLKAEGYDFIEDERKLFAFDFEQTAKKGVLGSAVSSLFGSFETPNQVLNGMANTRRYKPYLQGVDGRAGRQGYGGAIAGQENATPAAAPSPAAATGPNGKNLRVHPVGRHATDPTKYDDNWDIEVGFWQDTGLGDINEVYVRKNTVSISGITNGLAPTTPTVTTDIDRFVGSHNRLIGRGYDGAAPLNLQSFRTGYFASKYFGHYIRETEGRVSSNDVDLAEDGINSADMVTYNIAGNIDGHAGVTMNLHGGEKYYDRKNDYEFTVNTGATTLNLKADAALAPVFGGRMRIATIDQNDPNENLGASTMAETNALTETLYQYMRVKADGSNAQLVKEYRDVFNIGLLDDLFISSSANAATGGGVTSSIRIKFRPGKDATINDGDPTNDGLAVNLGAYEDRRSDELVGTRTVTASDGSTVTQNLMVEPGYLGQRSMFKNTNRAIADVFLSSFFAFKRPPKTKAQ